LSSARPALELNSQLKKKQSVMTFLGVSFLSPRVLTWETMGLANSHDASFGDVIGRCRPSIMGDIHVGDMAFLNQHPSVVIQRSSAICYSGSFCSLRPFLPLTPNDELTGFKKYILFIVLYFYFSHPWEQYKVQKFKY